MKLSEVKIYRITHIDNVAHIIRYGITHSKSINANPNFISIGDISLINTRRTKQVRIDNGDILNEDTDTIVLGDFIPFYFGVRMPMLYVMQHGGNFVEKPTPARDIVYLACSIKKVVREQEIFYFTDGHATDSMTSFYDGTMLKELVDIVDWNSVRAQYWGGDENLNTKRKKQAEFLVKDDVAFKNVVGIACYNEEAQKKLQSLGIDKDIILVKRELYY